MHVLLTNDDGVLATGLAAMHRALADVETVTVAAPDSVQSATAHGITVRQAINVRRIHVNNEFHAWSIAGRPADCVKLAVHELAQSKPNLVVSGINDGANVSINVLYSGTVAAAAEGALLGYPAVAVSLERGEEADFARAAQIARAIIDRLIICYLRPGRLVNINIPALRADRPKGIRVAAQALQTMVDRYEHMEAMDGVRQYLLDGEFGAPEEGHETDLHALHEGYVVVTPLHVDLTDRVGLAEMESMDWDDIAARGIP